MIFYIPKRESLHYTIFYLISSTLVIVHYRRHIIIWISFYSWKLFSILYLCIYFFCYYIFICSMTYIKIYICSFYYIFPPISYSFKWCYIMLYFPIYLWDYIVYITFFYPFNCICIIWVITFFCISSIWSIRIIHFIFPYTSWAYTKSYPRFDTFDCIFYLKYHLIYMFSSSICYNTIFIFTLW